MPTSKPLPEWDRVLSSAVHLQEIFPDAVLVGGTATAIHARHRVSVDADPVLTDLHTRFDESSSSSNRSPGGRLPASAARCRFSAIWTELKQASVS